jgi:predicted nucleic acid-binding protein
MAVARRWGEFPAARNLPVSGTLIAATAITLGLILVTRNENDVAATGVRLVNPLTTPQNSTP